MEMTSIGIILPSDSAREKHEKPVYRGGDLLEGFLDVNTCLEGPLCAVVTFEGWKILHIDNDSISNLLDDSSHYTNAL